MQGFKLSKILTIASFTLGGGFFVANLVLASVFAGRAWPGTAIAGQSVGGYSSIQLKQVVSAYQDQAISVDLKVSQKDFQLHSSDIDTRLDTPNLIASALEPPNHWLPVLGLFGRHQPIKLSWRVDSDKLSGALTGLLNQVNTPAADASIAIVGDKPTIVPGSPGTGVELPKAKATITDALAAGDTSLEISPGVVHPTITESDLEPIVKQMQALIEVPITLTYQGRSFSPDKATKASWLAEASGPAGPQIITRPDQIAAYLAKISKSIEVKAKNQVIDTVNGEVRSTTPGANGLAIDQAALTSGLSAAILAGQRLKTEIPTQTVAFKTVYNRTFNLDFGKYIEVNLSSQHMWVYQDHQVVLDTPITSGSAGTGHPTVQGLFNVYTKERNRYLDGRPLGYNYNVYVQYWMPFYKDYGLHDASWRSSFGGPDYYYGGSHGCVNMPIPAAAWLYNWVDVGTPVWVHS